MTTAPQKDKASAPAAPAKKLVIKGRKIITRPTFSLKAEGAQFNLLITGAMKIAKPLKGDKGEDDGAGGKKQREPAIIADATNIDTGEEGQIIVPSVLKGIFDDEYPNDSYVGKAFHILNQGKKESAGGQRYNKIHVEELELGEE